jgi:crotonobetainyl-CoA:carnitine CoA-transferase CaiB-like acyl-CoA transferase
MVSPETAACPAEPSGGALAGLLVVEVASGVAGPYCGKLLAGLGADVWKVEPPDGDSTRRDGPFPGDKPDGERSGLFLHLNTGKRSVALDPAAPGSSRLLGPLLARADVLLLGDRPAALAALGISPADLVARFPRLVVGNVATFGLTGPYAHLDGGELVAYAAGGYAMLTGDAARNPLKAYGHLAEYEAGAHLALGVLAALRARDLNGRGQVVDTATMEAATFMLGGVDQAAYFYGRVARRNGTRLLGFPPEHSYPSTIRPCRDGYVHAHSNNRFLDLLAALIPEPRLLEPELLATMMGHADEIDAIMDRWLASRDRRDVVAQAQQLRLPFTEVLAPGEVMADAAHRARGSFVTVEHPVAGPLLQPGAPIRLSATPWRTLAAPLLNADRAVLDALLAQPAATPASAEAAASRKGPSSNQPEFRSPRSATPEGDGSWVETEGRPSLLKPLHGVRVIDFTNAVAGPTATAVLADLGADVIKVEAPNGRPLVAAGTAPLRDGDDVPGYDRMMAFNELNHGKRGVVFNAATADGHALFLELIKTADLLVENFAPRVLPNLGLSYAELCAVRPDIILVRMPAFGVDGPYRDRIAYGPGVDAMSGLSHLTGYADGPPMKPGNFFCDQNAAIHAAFAVLAALRHRERSGQGQLVELTMIEGEFQLLGDAYIDYAMNGREQMRCGNDDPRAAPHDIFPCNDEDGWLAIAVETDRQWQALCRAIGAPALANDPRFAAAAERRRNRAALEPIIAAWTSKHGKRRAEALLREAGVPCAAVVDARELLADPQVAARDGFEYIEVQGVGAAPYPRVAFRLSGTPTPIAKAAPRFAEDNDAVFGDLLGLSAARRQALLKSGDIATVPAG